MARARKSNHLIVCTHHFHILSLLDPFACTRNRNILDASATQFIENPHMILNARSLAETLVTMRYNFSLSLNEMFSNFFAPIYSWCSSEPLPINLWIISMVQRFRSVPFCTLRPMWTLQWTLLKESTEQRHTIVLLIFTRPQRSSNECSVRSFTEWRPPKKHIRFSFHWSTTFKPTKLLEIKMEMLNIYLFLDEIWRILGYFLFTHEINRSTLFSHNENIVVH